MMNLEQIDTSTTAGKAEVMRLAAEGRKVAIRIVDEWAPRIAWVEKADPDWNWRVDTFAIIADPVGPDEVFVAIAPGPVLEGVSWNASDAPGHLRGRKGAVVKYIRADLVWEGK